jgi:UDP-glucose 4-epimerase
MTSIQRILVTGAGGFVCSNIIPVLLDYGYYIIALDRAFDAALRDEWLARWKKQVELIEAETTAVQDIKADAILHGAAVTAGPDEAGQSPEDNFRANLEPLLVALDWARQQKAQRAIFVSSSAVFRVSNGEITEDTPTLPLGLYAVAKQTTESLTNTLYQEQGGDVLTVRLSSIYGIGEQSRPSRPNTSQVSGLVHEALETGQLTIHRESLARDWTFAPDLGHALHQLLQLNKPRHALYNLASGERLASLAIGQAIQAVLPQVKLNILEQPDPKMASSTRRGWLSSQRLRQETGFASWTPFEQGIRQVIEAQQHAEFVS